LEELKEAEHLQNWKCPRCCVPDPGQQKKVEKMLSWRWIEYKYPEPIDPADTLKEGETLAGLEDMERRNR
jgi:hypothetical protein